METLEILPGYYRSSATSLDVRECLYADACVGGSEAGEYCATGYGGPCKKFGTPPRGWIGGTGEGVILASL